MVQTPLSLALSTPYAYLLTWRRTFTFPTALDASGFCVPQNIESKAGLTSPSYLPFLPTAVVSGQRPVTKRIVVHFELNSASGDDSSFAYTSLIKLPPTSFRDWSHYRRYFS